MQIRYKRYNSQLRLTIGVLATIFVQACATVGIPEKTVGIPENRVQFPSLDATPQHPPTMLDGYLFKPKGDGRHPALVFLHGCGGLLNARSGEINLREADWAARLTRVGYVVLMVDSLSPRGHGEMCSRRGFDRGIYLQRPKDAYGALRYLQAQPFVRPDRVGLMGWSQGGGVILLSIRTDSLGRSAELPAEDFRVAVAFYPGSCNAQVLRSSWNSEIPLLVLIGERDNWTPVTPCKALVDGAVGRGSKVEMRIYPDAYHDFDWPNKQLGELPAYRTSSGVVPITGMNPAARADALERVPKFLAKYLQD